MGPISKNSKSAVELDAERPPLACYFDVAAAGAGLASSALSLAAAD